MKKRIAEVRKEVDRAAFVYGVTGAINAPFSAMFTEHEVNELYALIDTTKEQFAKRWNAAAFPKLFPNDRERCTCAACKEKT